MQNNNQFNRGTFGTTIAVATFFYSGSLFGEINNALQMQLGNPTNATTNSSNNNNYLLDTRAVNAIDFSNNLGLSNWVSWDLTSPDIGNSGRSNSFTRDTLLPSNFNRLTTSDYTNSGFNRGHMCPSLDRTDTLTNNKETFKMSNVIPQEADNNQGPWQDFEAYCQGLAQAGDELLITSGPSLFTGSYIQPSGEAAIPGYTWKIVVVVPPGSGTALSRITTSTRVIALKIPNISGIRSDPWEDYITSASVIEADTGFTFFTALPNSVASVLRTKVDGQSGGSSGTLTISQVYGGGGNSSATFNKDFIELYNGGTTSINLSGYAVQYASSTGSSWSKKNLTGTIAPSGYFLIQLSGGSNSTPALPTPDLTASINMSASKGKVALTDTTSTLSGSNPVGGSSIVDFVGFGSANAFEGSGSTSSLSSTKAAIRDSGGATDTDDNAADFSALTPTPRNSLSGGSSGGLAISQVYGGGGNSGSVYKNDFVELYNASSSTINLSSYAVQYASSSGSSWSKTNLVGSIAPGSYYLIKLGGGSGGTTELPTPQVTGTSNMSGSSGKVALTDSQTLLVVSNPTSNSDVVDFVGFGSANAYEGSGATPSLNSSKSAHRGASGATDTDDNAADFATATPNPRNS